MQYIVQGASDETTITDMEQMDIDDDNYQQEAMEDLSLQYLWLVMLTMEYFDHVADSVRHYPLWLRSFKNKLIHIITISW